MATVLASDNDMTETVPQILVADEPAPLAGDPIRRSIWYANNNRPNVQNMEEQPGAPLTKLECWWARPARPWTYGGLRGMRVTFHNGYVSPIYGTAKDNATVLNLKMGERIKYFGVSAGRYADGTLIVTQFDIRTDAGQSHRFGYQTPEVGWASMNVHSGFLFRVAAGIADYGAGPTFKTVQFGWLSDLDALHCEMHYTTTPDPTKIQSVSYKQLTGDNRNSDIPLEMSIEESESETNTMTTEKTEAEEFGEKLSVSATVGGKVFGIGAEGTVGSEIEIKETKTISNSSSYEKTNALTWSMRLTVPPRERYVIKCLYYKMYLQMRVEPEIIFITKNDEKIGYRTAPQRIEGGASGVAVFEVNKQTLPANTSNQMTGIDGKPVLLGGVEEDKPAFRATASAGINPLPRGFSPVK